jgi:hypothetical protein
MTAQTPTRCPLAWPASWQRTPPAGREHARFRNPKRSWSQGQSLTVAEGLDRLQTELDRLGVADGDVIVSTNLVTRLDGLPRSGQGEPQDPGVAVYFRLHLQDRCLACDRYRRVADNMAAIAAHIDALRAIERYGVGTMDQAFAGYTALPMPAADAVAWWDVLRLDRATATRATIEAAFRSLAVTHHPDAGGSHDAMVKLSQARDAALREVSR